MGQTFKEDRFARTPSGWRFRSRRITLSFFVPLAEGWAETDDDQ